MPSTLGCHFAAGKFGDNSRYPSDDWVRQTDHLSIESPVIPDTNPIWGVGGKLPLQDDDVVRHFSQMNCEACVDHLCFDCSFTKQNMDSEEGTTNHGHRPQVASMSSAQTPFSFHPSERRLRHSSSTSTMIPPAGPSVNVLPPCPAPPSVPYFEPRPPCPSTRPSSPVSSSSMMVLSSLPSYVNVAASSPRRQQRFTMGPRADCEKCRLGIKGHWVHY